MMNTRRNPLTAVFTVGALLCALLFSTSAFAQAGKGEHAFKGVVQKIDVKAKSMTVDRKSVV